MGNSRTDGHRFSGGQLAYDFKLEKKSEFSPNNYTETETGGNEARLQAFAEYSFADSQAGVSLGYIATESRKSNYDDDGDKGTSSSDAFSTALITGYGVVNLTQTVHLKPAVSYSQLLQSTLNNIKADVSNSLDISVGLSSTF